MNLTAIKFMLPWNVYFPNYFNLRSNNKLYNNIRIIFVNMGTVILMGNFKNTIRTGITIEFVLVTQRFFNLLMIKSFVC